MINIYIIYIMYEFSTYKLKIGKYGKYIQLLGKNNEKIFNVGIDKEIQNKSTIYNLNENVLNKLLLIHSNKIMNQNLNKDILKMLKIETETEPEPEEKKEIKIKLFNDHI